MARPNSLGLFLCERVIVERDSEFRTFFRCFDDVHSASFPFTLSAFDVYAALTDGQGRIDFDLVLTNLNDDVQLVEHTVTLDIPNPLAIAHLRIRISGLSLAQPGQYMFELLADGAEICHRRLNVHHQEG